MCSLMRWRNSWLVLICFAAVQHINRAESIDTTTEIEYSVSSSTSIAVGSSTEPHQITEVAALISNEQGHKINHTREALSQSASEHDSVVFVGEPNSYVPVPALRSHHVPPSSAGNSDWQYPIDSWDREYRRFRFNTTRVQHIEAECQDDFMKIRIGFNGSFSGLLYSAGYAYDPDCMYVNGSETGKDYYEFYIQLNRCGTLGKNSHHEDNRKFPTKNFMWNTITVQYNSLIEEEFDEHFKVTCEYGYEFWKTVTFPFLDVEVATGNPVVFTLSPPECYMEIRYGYGTSGNRVTGPVRVGDPLTLIIYMRSKYDGFDVIVNDCYAHNGATKKIQLINEFGCPVDEKLISHFRGAWSDSGVFETQVFAYMKTFRFTGSPALYIECDVRMCHGRCPSQSCHWRNGKNVKKRSLDADTAAAKTPSLSENVNLFQSLRVLQEGESEEEGNYTSHFLAQTDSNNVCLKTGWFSALLAFGGSITCLLAGALLATCSKLRRSRIDKVFGNNFNGYMAHKGRIN